MHDVVDINMWLKELTVYIVSDNNDNYMCGSDDVLLFETLKIAYKTAKCFLFTKIGILIVFLLNFSVLC